VGQPLTLPPVRALQSSAPAPESVYQYRMQ
jgi:hypothetical protein